MSKATVELDFFGMEKDMISTPKPLLPRTRLPRPRSLRDIQGAISKINPELRKFSITAGYRSLSPEAIANQPLDSKRPPSAPSSPVEGFLSSIPTLPSLSPFSRLNMENIPDTAPLTIFYNGTVTVFDVPKDKAETILKFAEKGISKVAELGDTEVAVASADSQQLLEALNEDLPIARKKSLQRFLEKRKERLTSASPYCLPA